MRTPDFWTYPRSWQARLLSPFGVLYGKITERRLANANPFRVSVPVICVGNVMAGGSGKTPTVQAFAHAAKLRGIKAHILSRGYGGALAGPVRVDPARHTAAEVGDEPLLLAATAPTWVGRNRVATATAAIAAGAQLILMDDGLQNPSLAKDFSLLVIDGGFGFGNGYLIPAGPLRESIRDVAARVQAALIIGKDATGAIDALPAGLPVFHAGIAPLAHDLAGQRVVAFAGLGRPAKFRDTLREAGVEIAKWIPFADHHVYTNAELAGLAEIATALQARLVTTEKDFARLPSSFRPYVTVFPIVLTADDPGMFDRFLDQVLQ